MERPWFLSRRLLFHGACNSLGILEASLMLLPIILHPDRLLNQRVGLLLSIASVLIDFVWRLTSQNEPVWLRLLSPFEGGAVILVPWWLIGSTFAGVCAFCLAVN
jgi:hypothetical protein